MKRKPELESELVILLTHDVKKELVEGINECNNLVSSRYVGSLNNERNRTEICKIFSEYLRYFIDKNHLPARASYEVKAVPDSNNSVDIVFPDWVILNIDPKYSI